MQKRSAMHECVIACGMQCGNRTRLRRVSSPKVNPDKKIPKFEDWKELKFEVFLRRQDYSELVFE